MRPRLALFCAVSCAVCSPFAQQIVAFVFDAIDSLQDCALIVLAQTLLHAPVHFCLYFTCLFGIFFRRSLSAAGPPAPYILFWAPFLPLAEQPPPRPPRPRRTPPPPPPSLASVHDVWTLTSSLLSPHEAASTHLKFPFSTTCISDSLSRISFPPPQSYDQLSAIRECLFSRSSLFQITCSKCIRMDFPYLAGTAEVAIEARRSPEVACLQRPSSCVLLKAELCTNGGSLNRRWFCARATSFGHRVPSGQLPSCVPLPPPRRTGLGRASRALFSSWLHPPPSYVL